MQTSHNILAPKSRDNRFPIQDTDNPLPNGEAANAAQREQTTEHYHPWFGDSPKDPGLIPNFLGDFGVFSSMLTLLIFVCIFCFYSISDETDPDDPRFGCFNRDFPLPGTSAMAIVLWMPLICGYLFWSRYRQSNKLKSIAAALISVCLFGLLSWVYCALVSSEMDSDIISLIRMGLQTWSTGSVPQSFRGCDARVEVEQASLFRTDIYYTQFARTTDIIHNNSTPEDAKYTDCLPTFDMERFRSIQRNQTLCDQGFKGNNDLYGLGIRISLYLQWLSLFLANNLLPRTRQELRKPYLIFSTAICLVTIITSFANACIFSIEIEIMYWMYWGGYVCVFALAPCQIRLGSETKWIKLDWSTVIIFTTHALMLYHGVWFIWHAYDQVFSRMPCGTYHFFFFPILDPSQGFWTLRDYLTDLLIPLLPTLLAIFPFVGFLLTSEVKYTIQHSATYQSLFPKSSVLDRDQPQSAEYDTSVQTSLGVRVYLFIALQYRAFRERFDFPSHSRGGIRLVTPIEIRDRMCVAFVDHDIFAEL